MRPSLDEYMMGLARLAAARTTCMRRGVGCVLVNERNHVLAVSYNGVASGQPHCNLIENTPVYHDDLRVKLVDDFSSRDGRWIFKDNSVQRFGPEFFAVKGNRQCVGYDQETPNACKDFDRPSGRETCEAVHAEQNALLQCGNSWDIATAYVTRSPCKACLKLLLNTTCRQIVFETEHSDPLPKELWLKAGRLWDRLKIQEETDRGS